MARTFQTLSAAGWTERDPHDIRPGSTIRVLDDSVPQNLAPAMLHGDAGLYICSQVQRAVNVAVITDAGPTTVSIDFTDA